MMKRFFLFVTILALMVPVTAGAADYAHSFKADEMTVSWTLEGDTIHVELSAPTEGWVAIGFDPESAMQGADIIIGAVKDGKVRIEDHFGDRKRGHSPDKKLGGANDVMDPAGKEENGVTTISFTRKLSAADKYDKAVKTDGPCRILVAYGSGRDSFKAIHKYRALMEVNFSTGDAKKLE